MFIEFVANPIPNVMAASQPTNLATTSSNSLCISKLPVKIWSVLTFWISSFDLNFFQLNAWIAPPPSHLQQLSKLENPKLFPGIYRSNAFSQTAKPSQVLNFPGDTFGLRCPGIISGRHKWVDKYYFDLLNILNRNNIIIHEPNQK